MAQNGALFVICSSCKILYFASYVHPKIATELLFHTRNQSYLNENVDSVDESSAILWLKHPSKGFVKSKI